MIKAVDLRKGKTVTWENETYVVHESHHVAKGNKRSYMQAKLRNLKTGIMKDARFNVDDRLEVPFVETKEYEYLYQDGKDFVLMDTTSYEQINVAADTMGDTVQFLKANDKVTITICQNEIVGVELPFVVELKITDTSPVVKGATATNQMKDAILETGTKVRVPPFVEIGEVVRIDTRTGEYIDRAK